MRNGNGAEIRFQKAANAQPPHIDVLESDLISAVCQSSFASHGASRNRGSDKSFSFGARKAQIIRPSPTPPNTKKNIDLKPISPQRTERSITESAGLSGST